MTSEQCYQHTAKCYDGPPAEAIRDRALEPGMSEWFDEVLIPPDSMERGDVVVWRTDRTHSALALGDTDKVYQKGFSSVKLDDLARAGALRRKRTERRLSDDEREELRNLECEIDDSDYSTEGFARADELKGRGAFGTYTVYRLKPQFRDRYFTCAQLDEVPCGQVPHIMDGRPCWCGRKGIHGGQHR